MSYVNNFLSYFNLFSDYHPPKRSFDKKENLDKSQLVSDKFFKTLPSSNYKPLTPNQNCNELKLDEITWIKNHYQECPEKWKDLPIKTQIDFQEKTSGILPLYPKTKEEIEELPKSAIEYYQQAFQEDKTLKEAFTINMRRALADRIELELKVDADHLFTQEERDQGIDYIDLDPNYLSSQEEETKNLYFVGRVTKKQAIGIGLLVMFVAPLGFAAIASLFQKCSTSSPSIPSVIKGELKRPDEPLLIQGSKEILAFLEENKEMLKKMFSDFILKDNNHISSNIQNFQLSPLSQLCVGFGLGLVIHQVYAPLTTETLKLLGRDESKEPFLNLPIAVKILSGPLIVLIMPLLEEEFFRGDLLTEMKASFKAFYLDQGYSHGYATHIARITSIFFSSVIFGGSHFANAIIFCRCPTDFLPQAVATTIMGLMFGIAKELSGSIHMSIGMHMGNNALAWGRLLYHHLTQK